MSNVKYIEQQFHDDVQEAQNKMKEIIIQSQLDAVLNRIERHMEEVLDMAGEIAIVNILSERKSNKMEGSEVKEVKKKVKEEGLKLVKRWKEEGLDKWIERQEKKLERKE